jgi:UDP-N-acetylglucosamine transferase subunit ALG13
MILLSVGTNEQPFDRLVACGAGLVGREPVVVQHGSSALRPAGADCRGFVSFEEMEALIASARAVVCHAGVGSVGVALRLGKRPIVMARRRQLGEAVDDHQVPFARRLAEAGLAVVVGDADELERAVAEAAPTGAILSSTASPLALELRTYLQGPARVRRAATTAA